ncbi:hypothetical protein B0T26DRAFT_675060 [Lasiosphaeria miniovina]|uniref:Lytic polysaccharide monooxygenase n=1 Tax=Lasiosphaeria miniovina TaxID=1954250 RepID=A0AA40AX02_9PEZI|nr:uncharacterized protein B0T26DRAFT_675060 [Lasiosphaeria miniovina]KAK0723496.1 hypothetical protein B0T26DRAFT_675060 [Lasiosphaeria miniovina]
MQLSVFTYLSLSVAGFAAAHSWVECVDFDKAPQIKLMEEGAKKNPVDPADPVFHPEFCKGWPRAKDNPGNWQVEGTTIAWNINAAVFLNDRSACSPPQREFKPQGPNTPIATAKAGGTITLRYGGNGHSRGKGANGNGDPGNVQVFWAGKKETELKTLDDLTDKTRIAKAGFSDESFALPADKSVVDPDFGLIDKGNWMTVTLPANMEPGRHMLVWLWSFKNETVSNAPQWSSCFDVIIS